MWNTNRQRRDNKIIMFADYACTQMEEPVQEKRLSSAMAMFIGALITLEIMIGGAMVMNLDIHAMDGIAAIFVFIVLYSGIVAFLADR